MATQEKLGLPEVEGRIAQMKNQLGSLPQQPAPQAVARVGFHSSFVGTTLAARWVQVDLGEAHDFESVVIVPAYFTPTENGSGAYGMPSRFRLDASDGEDFATYQTLLDQTETDAVMGLGPVFIKTKTRARFLRFTATRLAQQRLGRGFFALGELLVFSGELNIAAGCAVTSSGAYETQPTWQASNLTDGITHLGSPLVNESVRSNGWHSAITNAADQSKWVQLDLGNVQPLDEVRLYPAHPPDFPERTGFGFPLRFRVEISDEPSFGHPRLLLDATGADFTNPADNAVLIPAHGKPARYVRMTATRLWERSNDFIFALAEMEVFSSGRNIARDAKVTSLDETKTTTWSSDMLVDGRTSLGRIISWPQWLEGLSNRQETEHALTDWQRLRETLLAKRQQNWLVVLGIAALIIVLAATGLTIRQRTQQRRSVVALRRQIARDLHDEIGSSLGSISLMSELAIRDGDASALQEIHRLSREATESMRGIIWLVRETDTPTLERLVETMRQTAGSLLAGVPWELTSSTDEPAHGPSLDFHRHVFLFFKEALHNVVRHAQAGNVRIKVAWSSSQFTMSLHDDGIGFDPETVTVGSGLANLRHRAESLRGRMTVSSRPRQGTVITLEAPIS